MIPFGITHTRLYIYWARKEQIYKNTRTSPSWTFSVVLYSVCSFLHLCGIPRHNTLLTQESNKLTREVQTSSGKRKYVSNSSPNVESNTLVNTGMGQSIRNSQHKCLYLFQYDFSYTRLLSSGSRLLCRLRERSDSLAQL